MLGRAFSYLRGGIPVALLASWGRDGADAYDLVDQLPRGRARAAAWNAYACQTCADKLVQATARNGFASFETARVVRALYGLVDMWLERARTETDVGRLELELPPWGSTVPTREQLVGMRDALYALRTYVAYDLGDADSPLQGRLEAVDRSLAAVDALWIERPTTELRGGIGDRLAAGIHEACALGRLLALDSPSGGSRRA